MYRTLGMLSLVCVALILAFPANAARAEELSLDSTRDSVSGFDVWTLKGGRTELKVVPEAGANVYSLKFDGRELLKTPNTLKELRGFGYGVPLLYPTPNRVRDAAYTFEGKKFAFPPNEKKNFLHGLVHSASWRVARPAQTEEGIGIDCLLQFAPGSERYRLFPYKHDLQMSYRVRDGKVLLRYRVDNQDDKPLPFGFALHPWFLYLGERANTYLTIPATHHMEATHQLPSGKLEPLDGSPFDARKPRSLKGFVIDDVYYGMLPNKPVIIDQRDARLRLSLRGTADFTHLVVYTPNEKWFCVENQTCATDAHNLYGKGFKQESHLQIVPPGKQISGDVEIRIEKY